MNGEPLRPTTARPFRLIVPHWYAVASVKWLKRIDVLTEPFVGEFQTGHYMYEWPDRPPRARRPSCASARGSPNPRPGAVLAPGTAHVRGKAWSGTGPVTGSSSASPAKASGTRPTSSRPTGPTTGRTGPSSGTAALGRHSIRARATDAAGNVQPEVPPWNRLGYGNNAIEVTYVDVR